MAPTKTATETIADLDAARAKNQAHADSFGSKRVAIMRGREDKTMQVAEAMARGDEQTATALRAEIVAEDVWLASADAAGGLAQKIADKSHAAYGEAVLPGEIDAAKAFVERLEQLVAQVAQVSAQIVAARQRVRELHRLRCRPLSPHDEPPAPVISLSPTAARMLAVVTGTN